VLLLSLFLIVHLHLFGYIYIINLRYSCLAVQSQMLKTHC